MMRYFTQFFLLSLISIACCCQKPAGEDKDSTKTEAPTAITVSPESISASAEGSDYQLTVNSPVRPKLSGLPDWITMKDGVFNNYKITFTLTVKANPTYSSRTATLTVSATGMADKTVAVSQEGQEEPVDPGTVSNDAIARTLELGLGCNMGNHFDAYSNGVANETAWQGKSATQATFNGVKAAGFTSVRIPVTWMGHIGEAPDYALDEKWLNRVYEVVGYAENAGLKVILNTHHDEDHGEGDGNHWQDLRGAVNSDAINTQVKAEIAAVWGQIAAQFKDKGDFLMLESFNELIYGNEWSSSSNTEKKCAVINEWNQVFVNAVRATGGNNATRWLGVPGYAANPGYLKYLTIPSDPAGKIMLAFHCYDPYDYTIGDKQLPDWGHTGTSYKNGENEIRALFSDIFNTYIAKNVPVYMGEFGCSMRNKNDAKAWAYFCYYLEYVVKAAKTYGFAPFLWDNGANGYGQERHGYIDHGNGKVTDNGTDPVKAMVKAWNTSSSSYTLDSVYNSAPTF